MLNRDDNESGFKTNRSNQQKNKFACAARFFVFPLTLFFTTSMLFCMTKTSNVLVTHYFYGGADERSLTRSLSVRPRDYQIFSDGQIITFPQLWGSAAPRVELRYENHIALVKVSPVPRLFSVLVSQSFTLSVGEVIEVIITL